MGGQAGNRSIHSVWGARTKSMPLKIIGAGYGRTGTYSTHLALNQLGFPCYHMVELLQHAKKKAHFEFWQEVATSSEGSQHDWEQVYGHYSAAVDNPTCCVWRELADAYPDAKVLLTLHPKGAEMWYESYMDTIYDRSWLFGIFNLIPRFSRRSRDMRYLIETRSLGGKIENREAAIAQYEKRIEDVKSAVSADRLLIFSADQGWEPLCKFLEVDVPDFPFPKANERHDTKRQIRAAKIQIGIVLCGIAAAIVAAIRVNLKW